MTIHSSIRVISKGKTRETGNLVGGSIKGGVPMDCHANMTIDAQSRNAESLGMGRISAG